MACAKETVVKVAPSTTAPVNVSPDKSTPDKVKFVSCALLKSMLVSVLPVIVAFLKIAPDAFAYGPSRYPQSTNQCTGRLLGTPTTPPERNPPSCVLPESCR